MNTRESSQQFSCSVSLIVLVWRTRLVIDYGIAFLLGVRILVDSTIAGSITIVQLSKEHE